MRNITFLFISLLFTGCESSSHNRVACPKTAILAEFSKTVDLTKGEPIKSEIDSLNPECFRDENSIQVDFKLRITSFRSLASSRNAVKINPSYFIALVDKEGVIISRSNHTFEVIFDPKQTTKVSFQYLQEKVPANKEAAIYVGFNLEESEIEFLKKEREGKSRHPKRQ